MRKDDDGYDEDSELGRVVNVYAQSRNGGGSNLNTILLTALLAIVGFLGIQIWSMSDRLARLETSFVDFTKQK